MFREPIRRDVDIVRCGLRFRVSMDVLGGVIALDAHGVVVQPAKDSDLHPEGAHAARMVRGKRGRI